MITVDLGGVLCKMGRDWTGWDWMGLDGMGCGARDHSPFCGDVDAMVA
jgi:hypothetical protein